MGAQPIRLARRAWIPLPTASAPDRPRAVGKKAVPTPFAGDFSDYRDFGGIRVPTTAAVRWELADGPFVYFRARINSFATA